MAVFLSSASITLIAVDRYRYIIHPHSKQMSTLLVSRLSYKILELCIKDSTLAMTFCDLKLLNGSWY